MSALRLPVLFDCGCSHLKVSLGRCDVYNERGELRELQLEREQLERQHAARLEEAQRFAVYAELYRALAVYHRLYLRDPDPAVVAARARACDVDAERCNARLLAIVFGPWPELG